MTREEFLGLLVSIGGDAAALLAMREAGEEVAPYLARMLDAKLKKAGLRPAPPIERLPGASQPADVVDLETWRTRPPRSQPPM